MTDLPAGSAEGGAAPPPIRLPAHPWIVAISVLAATFMEVLDTTVVNVSLPHIAGNLSASNEEATWTLTSYLVANAIVLPMTGWLASRVGRRRLLLGSIIGFTATSLVCGLSTSLAQLVVARILQGLTGGTLQPISQSVMLESFPPEKRGRAMGFWALGIVVAPMLGPILGGWLTDRWSWHWVFFINVPIGLAAWAMIRANVQDPPYLVRHTAPVDGWGLGLLVVGIGSLQFVLDKGQQEDWFESRLILTLAVLAAAALVALVVRELRSANPILDLRVFRLRTFSVGVFLMTCLGMVLYGSIMLLPLMLQTLLGYSSYDAGVAVAPRGLGSFLAMPVIGLLVGRFDARKMLVGGLVTGAFTLFWLARMNLSAGYWDWFWPQFIMGISLGLLFVPLTTLTMHSIPLRQMGHATSLFNLMRNIGGSAGIALSATLVSRQQQGLIGHLGGNVTAYDPASRSFLEGATALFRGQGIDAQTAARAAELAAFGRVARQASLLAFLETFRVLGAIFLLVVPLVALMRRARPGAAGPSAPH